jgi:hypothetical protein
MKRLLHALASLLWASAALAQTAPSPTLNNVTVTGQETIAKDVLQGLSTRNRSGVATYAGTQFYGGPLDAGGNVASFQFSNDASTSFFGTFKSRGTTKGQHVAVQPGDDILEINGSGSDGANYVNPITIDAVVDGTVTPGSIPASFSIWLSDGISPKQGLFIDHSRNVYVRNGYLAIGSDFGWKPPSVTGAVPSAPLTIAEPLAGALVNAYYSGSNGGGAQVMASNGYSATQPIYAFWWNNGTGLGNPALNQTSIISNSVEVARFTGTGLGIFKTSPSYALDVVGGARVVSATATDVFQGYMTGTSGGGAEILSSNGYSATRPIYAFWWNNGTGLGNPALNVGSLIVNSVEVARFSSGGFAANAFVAQGSILGAGGTCIIGGRQGGSTAGSFTASSACTAGTIVLSMNTTAPNGWHCTFNDETTHADTALIYVTAHTASQVTATATMAAGDTVTYACMGF